MYDEELDMALEDAYDDGYIQALIDMGVDPDDIAEEDVDMFDDNYFDEAMEGNPENKAKRREWEVKNGSQYGKSGFADNYVHASRYANKLGDDSRGVTDKQRHLNKQGPTQQYARQFQKVRDRNVRSNGLVEGYHRRSDSLRKAEDRDYGKLEADRKRIERSGYHMPDYNARHAKIAAKYGKLRDKNEKMYSSMSSKYFH
jgi:hypothetical protein